MNYTIRPTSDTPITAPEVTPVVEEAPVVEEPQQELPPKVEETVTETKVSIPSQPIQRPKMKHNQLQDTAYQILDDIRSGTPLNYSTDILCECLLWWANQAQTATLNCQYLHGQLTLHEVVGKMRKKKNPEFDDFANLIERSLNALKK